MSAVVDRKTNQRRRIKKATNLKVTKITRREALSTAGKIAITAILTGAIAGIGGYYVGNFTAPRKTVTSTVTKATTVTKAASIVTRTVTETTTVRVTSPQKPKIKELKVGVIMPLTGPVAGLTFPTKQMVEMLFDEYNKKGRVKLIPVWADDKGDPSQTVSEGERLITVEKVPVIFGAFTSGGTLALAPVCEKYHVPLVIMTAFSEKITRQGYKYVFRAHVTTTPYVNSMMEFVTKKLKPKTLAHIYENSVWGTTNDEVVKKWIKEKGAGIELVLSEGYSRKPPINLTPVISKVKDAKPDILVCSAYLDDAIATMKTMYELDCYVPYQIAFGGGFTDPKFIKEVGKLALGVFVACYGNHDISKPTARSLIDEYYRRYGHWPTGDALVAAQGFQVLVDAIERAESPSPNDIWKALKSTNIPEEQGLLYGVKFDENGDNIYAFSFVTQIQKNEKGELDWFTVWPEKYATRQITKPLLPYDERLKDP